MLLSRKNILVVHLLVLLVERDKEVVDVSRCTCLDMGIYWGSLWSLLVKYEVVDISHSTHARSWVYIG